MASGKRYSNMAAYALKNKTTRETISAHEAKSCDHRGKYFCPNSNCNAQMHIVQKDIPYFSADKNFPHVPFCSYASNSSFDPGKYNERRFNLDSIKKYLFAEKNGNTVISKGAVYVDHEHSNNLPIKTLRVLYDMCKSKGINQSYGNIPINNMLYDSRCEDVLPQMINGFRIVECQTTNSVFLEYDKQQSTITLHAPASSPNKGQFVLRFNNYELFWEVQKQLYHNRNNIIVVAGIWEPGANPIIRYSQIVSKRQIIIIKTK